MKFFAEVLDTSIAATIEREQSKASLHIGFEMILNNCLMKAIDITMASLSPEMKLKFMEMIDDGIDDGDEGRSDNLLDRPLWQFVAQYNKSIQS